jgi:hypothetical protein
MSISKLRSAEKAAEQKISWMEIFERLPEAAHTISRDPGNPRYAAQGTAKDVDNCSGTPGSGDVEDPPGIAHNLFRAQNRVNTRESAVVRRIHRLTTNTVIFIYKIERRRTKDEVENREVHL